MPGKGGGVLFVNWEGEGWWWTWWTQNVRNIYIYTYNFYKYITLYLISIYRHIYCFNRVDTFMVYIYYMCMLPDRLIIVFSTCACWLPVRLVGRQRRQPPIRRITMKLIIPASYDHHHHHHRHHRHRHRRRHRHRHRHRHREQQQQQQQLQHQTVPQRHYGTNRFVSECFVLVFLWSSLACHIPVNGLKNTALKQLQDVTKFDLWH